MKAPSRGKIVAVILFTFLALFLGGITYYLSPLIFGPAEQGPEFEESSNGFTFFPFGRGGSESPRPVTDDNDTLIIDTDTEIDLGNETSVLPQLRRLSEVPAAGIYMEEVSFSQNQDILADNELEPIPVFQFRYVESETGNVYEGRTDTNIIDRISNTTIPGIFDALFVNFDSMILRYFDSNDSLKTFSADYVEPLVSGDDDELGRIQGIFFEDDIQNLTLSSENEVFYTKIEDNSTVGIRSNDKGQDRTQIWTSLYREWRPSYGDRANTILLNTFPSVEAPGFVYTLSDSTSAFTPLISGERAVSAIMSPDGNKVMASAYVDGQHSTFIRNSDGTYTDLGTETLAEKCVWAADSVTVYCAIPFGGLGDNDPDRWYQGISSFSDGIWKIDSVTGDIDFVYSPIATDGINLDIYDLAVTDGQDYLTFRDRMNDNMWLLFIPSEE